MDELVSTLESLKVSAPRDLSERVLLEVDLADRYAIWPFELAGDLVVSWNSLGLSALEFADRTVPSDLATALGRPVVRAEVSEIPDRWQRSLEAALVEGRRAHPPLDQRGVSEFRRAALTKASEIPRGEVRSYGWIARELGRPGAARAVGTAMATNRHPILLPCHRVVPSDGSLGNYGGGPERKRVLLASEGVDVDALEERAVRGTRFVANDSTGIFCAPTCRNARRISPVHLVELHNEAEARREGFRPCQVCRPARRSWSETTNA